MITRESTKEILHELVKSGQFQQAIDDDGNYVYITVSIFNAGSVAHILSCDYNEESEAEAANDGDLFIDKDDALRLIDEYGINLNPEISEGEQEVKLFDDRDKTGIQAFVYYDDEKWVDITHDGQEISMSLVNWVKLIELADRVINKNK